MSTSPIGSKKTVSKENTKEIAPTVWATLGSSPHSVLPFESLSPTDSPLSVMQLASPVSSIDTSINTSESSESTEAITLTTLEGLDMDNNSILEQSNTGEKMVDELERVKIKLLKTERKLAEIEKKLEKSKKVVVELKQVVLHQKEVKAKSKIQTEHFTSRCASCIKLQKELDSCKKCVKA